MHYKKCEICGIRSGRTNDEKRIFMAKFPKDEERCRQWVKVVGNEDLVYVPIEKLYQLRYVCGQHFVLKDFEKKGTRLKPCAVPSQELPNDPLPDHLLKEFPLHLSKEYITSKVAPNLKLSHLIDHHYCKVLSPETVESDEPEDTTPVFDDTYTSTAEEVDNPVPNEINKDRDKGEAHVSRQEAKLLKKIKLLQKKNRILNKKLRDIENIESPLLKSFIESAITNRKRKSFSKRWNNLNKSVSLEIYKKSPSTYKYLSTMLPMPSVRTLQAMLENMNKKPEINETVLQQLKEAGLIIKNENVE